MTAEKPSKKAAKRAVGIAAAVGVLTCAAIGYAVYENTAIQLARYEIASQALPESLAGLRICHLSDIHVKPEPRDYGPLIKAAASTEPDLITVSGDLVDSRVSDISAAVSLMETLAQIAPVYYVTGNHEERLPPEIYAEVLKSLEDAGVHLLRDSSELFVMDGVAVNIMGVCDRKYPDFDLIRSLEQDGLFNLLISHRPQFAKEYAEAGADLTVCGHAHGGQARIPFIGGLIAPDQMFFPEFYQGVHEFSGRYTVISRGIGNSLIPVRVNNRPEVVLIEIKR